MKLAKPERKPLLVLLVKRTVLFLLALCVLLLFLYAIGTAQDFLDSTQVLILHGVFTVGMLLTVGSAYGLVIDIGTAFFSRAPRYLWGMLSYLLLAFAGLALAGTSAFLLAAITGNVS